MNSVLRRCIYGPLHTTTTTVMAAGDAVNYELLQCCNASMLQCFNAAIGVGYANTDVIGLSDVAGERPV